MSHAEPLTRGWAAMAVLLLFSSCAAIPDKFVPWRSGDDNKISALEVQAAVMDMADEYIAALGEATYIAAAEARLDSKARALSQSFLRNGVGAAIDIAAGPNPNIALLDLMVLTSLQTWSYEKHWIPSGIGEQVGAASLDRLKTAETEIWQSAARILKPEQRDTVRGLIDAWIEANPDRMVVSLVRFDEFTDERRTESESRRRLAGNLIIDLDSATSTVDDARLLGERVLWFSGRYPYVLGEQAELTMYRLVDQPEARQVLNSLETMEEMGGAIQAQGDRLLGDISRQREAAFEQLRAERKATIEQAQATLAAVMRDATDEAFVRFAAEKTALLADIDTRQAALGSTLGEMGALVKESTALAQELAKTAAAFERVVMYFEPDPDSAAEPLDMADVRDAAIETSRAADRLTALLVQANDMMLSEQWEARVSHLDTMAAKRIDQFFWRGLVLVVLLLAGLVALRMLPSRRPKPDNGKG